MPAPRPDLHAVCDADRPRVAEMVDFVRANPGAFSYVDCSYIVERDSTGHINVFCGADLVATLDE